MVQSENDIRFFYGVNFFNKVLSSRRDWQKLQVS